MPSSVANTRLSIQPGGSPRWTLGQRGTAAFLIVFLLLQLGIPLAKLLGPRPARLGWQMFSSYVVQPTISVVYRDSTVVIEQARFLAHLRGEIRTGDRLPVHLCRVLPQVQAVVVQDGAAEPVKTPCH